jgi:hypothetical protein
MEFLWITSSARLVGDPLQIHADRFSGHYGQDEKHRAKLLV